jgi:Na+-driven multidrug efflux pump
VLAGVGLGNILCGSTNWVFGFLSVLTIPAVAKYMAQGRKDKACEHIGQGFWVALLVGTSTMMTLLINCPQLVHGAWSSLFGSLYSCGMHSVIVRLCMPSSVLLMLD